MSAGQATKEGGRNSPSAAVTDAAGSEEATDSSLLELTAGVKKEEGEGTDKPKKESGEALTVPPGVPQSGISILAHKIWIGNLDKRLSQ